MPHVEMANAVVHHYLDHGAWCKASLSIRDKRGVKVDLNLTPAQRKVSRAIWKQQRENKPIRGVVLKSRQVHNTVGVCAEMFRRVPFFPGQHAAIYADTEKTTSNIRDYMRQFQQSYRGLIPLPRIEKNNEDRLSWLNDSYFEYCTAGSKSAGRSFSMRFLLLSEFAFYPDAETLMTGLIPSVADDPGTFVVIESTANGVGNPFHQLWKRACLPGSDLFAVFFAWWEHPEYVRFVEDPQAFERSLSKDERVLRTQFDLSLEQLCWRRWKIQELGGDERKFHQEFPSTPEEAFLTSGRPRFDQVALGRMPINREPLSGELKSDPVGTRIDIRFNAREDGLGALQIWKRPDPNAKYVIGADPSKGHVQKDGNDPDYSVAQVLDLHTWEQVASLRERLVPGEFANYVCDLARYYNWAFLVPESNELGFIEGILQAQYPVHLIYQRRRSPDDRRPPTLEEIGFLTTNRDKLQMIHLLDMAIRQQTTVMRKANTVDECHTFVYKSNLIQAEDGCHDDEVIAYALAIVGATYAPREFRTPTQVYQHEQILEPYKYRNFQSRFRGREVR